MRESELSRRSVLKASAASVAWAIGGVSLASAATTSKANTEGVPGRERDAFYDGDGAFDPDEALQAYFDMMRRFGYPIPDVLKTDQFWVCDFLQRDFARLGMGGIFWVNEAATYGKSGAARYRGEFSEQRFGYLGHEIYLLPGQALPEHFHIGGPEGFGPKMETWHVRYGEVRFFGEFKGSGDEILISDLPPEERPWGYGEDWFKSKYVVKRTAKSGQLYSLKDPESCHFQQAGAEGAIVTEYATYHNDVRFTKPGMEFASTQGRP